PVSASFFSFFDAQPVLGRFFTVAEDSLPAGAPVAVIGYTFWQTSYGGRADVLGTAIAIGRITHTIIGVAPAGLAGIDDGGPAAVFIPITAYTASIMRNHHTNYGWDVAEMLVRRRPDVSTAMATVDITHAYEQSWLAENPSPALFASARPHAVAGP